MSLIAFIVAAVLLAITPGPGIAYVVARTASGGRSEGLASCAGTAVGGMLHVVAAALGLSLLLAQSAIAFSIVKYAGAAYLVYLGVRMLLRKTGERVADETCGDANDADKTARGVRKAFIEGIAVEALNVKTALFFVAFLPQFVSRSEALIPQLVLMGTICVALNTLVDIAAVLTAARLLRSRAAHAARARMMESVSGTTMIALGTYLALARRDAS